MFVDAHFIFLMFGVRLDALEQVTEVNQTTTLQASEMKDLARRI